MTRWEIVPNVCQKIRSSLDFSDCIFVNNYFTLRRITVVLRQKREVNLVQLPKVRQNFILLLLINVKFLIIMKMICEL